jgi:cytochrome b
MWKSFAGEKPMGILIDIILYLLAIVLSMTLGSIFKKTDDSLSKENVKNETKNRHRRSYPVHSMFGDLRH